MTIFITEEWLLAKYIFQIQQRQKGSLSGDNQIYDTGGCNARSNKIGACVQPFGADTSECACTHYL